MGNRGKRTGGGGAGLGGDEGGGGGVFLTWRVSAFQWRIKVRIRVGIRQGGSEKSKTLNRGLEEQITESRISVKIKKRDVHFAPMRKTATTTTSKAAIEAAQQQGRGPADEHFELE